MRTRAEISSTMRILRALELRKALLEAEGCISRACKALGISRSMFWRHLKRDNQRLDQEAREHGYV